jgi:serine/threonine-protein kinase
MSVAEGQSPTPAPLNPTTAADSSEPDLDIILPLLREATAGEYEIHSELGRGGMAAVYLATDLSLNRKVAIKTMLPELIGRGAMVARFKREAQMAAGLSHPHIVQIHSVKQTPRIVYFVMKFIEGRGLESIINDHGALDLDMSRLVLQQAASALSFAHHRGVIHRDVKPANIMIDENGWAVMTDFGIAKIDDGSNLTATGTAVGTPHYMAPEQFHNKPLTGAADQYSLGVVAYEMLSGKKPFEGSTLAEIITQHLFKDPPQLKVDRADLPESVSDTITRMLAKEPEQRFPDLDAAITSLGPPDPARVDAARGRLMSLARKSPTRGPRLSVPMSPIPNTRPSAPTTVLPKSAPVEVTPSGSIVTGKAAATAAVPAPAPAAAKAPAKAAAPASAPTESGAKKRRSLWPIWVATLLAVGVVAALYFTGIMQPRGRASDAALQRGVALWQQGRAPAAVQEFMTAARAQPMSALPHVYLSRIARERGDMRVALAEALRAAQLEPNSAIALREVGAVQLARGDNDAARRFFVRAVRVNPSDKASMGWLACSFQRMGFNDEAQRWSQRAGPGAWSACLQ